MIDEATADGVDILNLPRVDGGSDENGEPLGEGDSEQREEFRKRAVPMMFDEIQKSMKNFRVNFDVWFHENSLYSDGEVDKAIADLRPAATSSKRTAPPGSPPPSMATTRTA